MRIQLKQTNNNLIFTKENVIKIKFSLKKIKIDKKNFLAVFFKFNQIKTYPDISINLKNNLKNDSERSFRNDPELGRTWANLSELERT